MRLLFTFFRNQLKRQVLQRIFQCSSTYLTCLELLKVVEFGPSRHLIVQSQKWKQHNNLGNICKFINIDTRMTIGTSF